MLRFKIALITFQLLKYSSGRDLGVPVRRLNINNEESTQPSSSERDVKFALLWGEMAQSEDWDGYESIQHLLKGRSHSYHHHHRKNRSHKKKHKSHSGDSYEENPVLVFPPTSAPTSENTKENEIPTTEIPVVTNVPTSSPTTSSPTTSSPTTSSPTSSPTSPKEIEQTSAPTLFNPNLRSCPKSDDSVIDEIKINFAYVAETTRETTDFMIPLENVILDSVADSILSCAADSSLITLQSSPEDRSLNNVPCNITHPEAIACTVVLGYMTMGFIETKETTWHKKEAIQAIHEAMEDGTLVGRAKMADLVSLTFIGPKDKMKKNPDKSEEGIGSEGGNTLVMGASVAVIILFAGLALNSVRRKQTHDKKTKFDKKLSAVETSASRDDTLTDISFTDV